MTFELVRLLSPEDRRATLEADLRTGLAASPRWLSPIWLYDERGSALYDEITRVPEYYPARTEQAIFDTHADEMMALAGCDTLVELGSGTAEKTRMLLDAMVRAHTLRAFVALEVSEEILVSSARAIAEGYGIDVTAIVGDFCVHLPDLPEGGRRLFAFLGGTVGNFDPPSRMQFLATLAHTMAPEDALLLGTDLVKDRARLLAAYDDAQGITAAFDRNVLAVINAEFDGNFDLDNFVHRAVFDEEHSWIEMRLRAQRPQRVVLAGLGLTLDFAEGEEIRTEISTKFRPADLDAELVTAGFATEAVFLDPRGDFRVTLARRKG
jgi:L-histidine N-alpha-methyltransferase